MRKTMIWPIAVILGLLASCAGISPTPGGTESTSELFATDILVFIGSVDAAKGQISFDRVEWISLTNTDRISELGLDPETDFPNDYYIYNESEEFETLLLSKDVRIFVLDPEEPVRTMEIGAEELSKSLETHPGLYRIFTDEGAVMKVEAQYVP